MKHVEAIIVGGGPAGASCAKKLVENGRECLVLDKEEFPRVKVCAGAVTNHVFDAMGLSPLDYPHGKDPIRIKIHAKLHKWLPTISTPANFGFRNKRILSHIGLDCYSIRRVEFDAWLLEQSRADVEQHRVKKIEIIDGKYVIDGKYSCEYLVGAGGMHCPVRKTFFDGIKRPKLRLLAGVEMEFYYPKRDDISHVHADVTRLNGGMGWYVSKANGYVNIGVGLSKAINKDKDINLHHEFRRYLDLLIEEGLLDRKAADEIKEDGHPAYLYLSDEFPVKNGNAYVIGDSAGLVTTDFGEGIGPAVESGILCAREIMGETRYTRSKISKYTFGPLLTPIRVLLPLALGMPAKEIDVLTPDVLQMKKLDPNVV